MIETGSRLRQMGWLAVMALCIAAFCALSFRVHAVKSEVLLAERQIVRLQSETTVLETEFQTRASQRQLSDWNLIEFGYEAPRADQYVNSQVQLAALGEASRPDAPAPVRFARAAITEGDVEGREMVSPLSGQKITLASASVKTTAADEFGEAFGDMLIKASPIRPAQARTAPPASASLGAAVQ